MALTMRVDTYLKLMMDPTGSEFVAVVKRASMHLKPCCSSNFSTLFPNKHLALVYEMFELVTCLILDEDSYLADAALAVDRGDQHNSPDVDFQLLQVYCTFLAALARVNARYFNIIPQ